MPPTKQSKNEKPAVIILTVLLTVVLFLPALIIVLTGWFLPEPQYTANSFSEVIAKEVTLSVTNLLIDLVLFSLSIFFTLVFLLLKIFKFSILKSVLIVLTAAFTLSLVCVSYSILESLNFWQPLEEATIMYQDKTYSRGRGGGLGLQKVYHLNFTIPSDNIASVRDDLVPTLEKRGFSTDSISSGPEMINNLNQGEKFVITSDNNNYLALNFSQHREGSSSNSRINLIISFEDNPYIPPQTKPGTITGFLTMYP